ncbi:MAG: hypothetical protein JWO31_4020 [Phycisphaerales bacterium]|nr:hypothetical protein [Phycisphaerales bacterium]
MPSDTPHPSALPTNVAAAAAAAPRVTVLMAVRDEARFLPVAVDSVLGQCFSDFELLVVDDASADATPAVLAAAAARDHRVRVVRNDRNLGLTASLNRGLALAAGAFVGRLDGDDVARRDRLAAQVAFLDANPAVGIVGSSRTVVDEAGGFLYHAAALESDRDIRWRLLLGNPLAHPTVMIRRGVLAAHGLRYDESFRTAQDYELWTRLLTVTRAANLPDALVTYRRRAGGVSLSRREEQLAAHDRIAHLAIGRLVPGLPVSAEDVRQLRGRFGGQSVREPDMDPADEQWVERLAALRAAFDSVEQRGGITARPVDTFLSPDGAEAP